MTLNNLPLLSFPLDPRSVQRRVRWATGLSKGVSGAESRAFYGSIFLEVSGRTQPASPTEARRQEAVIEAALQAGECAFVDWSAPTWILAVNGARLNLDSPSDLTGCTHVFIQPPVGAGKIHAIATLESQGVTLTSEAPVTTGQALYPIRTGHLATPTRATIAAPLAAFDLRLTALIELPVLTLDTRTWNVFLGLQATVSETKLTPVTVLQAVDTHFDLRTVCFETLYQSNLILSELEGFADLSLATATIQTDYLMVVMPASTEIFETLDLATACFETRYQHVVVDSALAVTEPIDLSTTNHETLYEPA